MSWQHELWVCNSGYTLPEEHDGSCDIWAREAVYLGYDWFKAYAEAAAKPHAVVRLRYSRFAVRASEVFRHIEGGGLCAGCWRRHQVTHTEHVIEPDTGLCRPCIEVVKRRGPYTRTPNGPEFMCEDCRVAFRRNHEASSSAAGHDPNPRIYRLALEVAIEDGSR
ncbi:hypothetical protein [Kitasatospora sp. MBT66]|uniref:hypothetical protein n=1 Tax=Kitasatospora sp. MBT66 TaxID=1444769 RepID=UPI0005BD1FAB|nr:hypothetical protein [Kitasatospora sp. MBT66]